MKLFTMYIGLQEDKDHNRISQASRDLAIEVLKGELADKFGGYSTGEVYGGYRSNNGELAEELSLRVEVTARDEQVPMIRECAAMFRDLFRQESVLLNCTTIDSNFI